MEAFVKATFPAGNLYTVQLWNIGFTEFPITSDYWVSQKSINISLYHPEGILMEYSDPYERSNYITY
jgi:hypothetical protein